MKNIINPYNTNHVTSGIGVPPMTHERDTVFFNPVTTLFSGSRILGGSDAVGLVTLMYSEFGEGSLGPTSFTAFTRKVYSFLVVKCVTFWDVSVIFSVTLVQL